MLQCRDCLPRRNVGKTIRSVETSDASYFYKIAAGRWEKSYSSIHTIRGVLRPAFQIAVDDDILVKESFQFQLAGVLLNGLQLQERQSQRADEKVSKDLCMTMWCTVNAMSGVHTLSCRNANIRCMD